MCVCVCVCVCVCASLMLLVYSVQLSFYLFRKIPYVHASNLIMRHFMLNLDQQ